MPKDTKSLDNNKAPACESRGFVHKKKKACILTHLLRHLSGQRTVILFFVTVLQPIRFVKSQGKATFAVTLSSKCLVATREEEGHFQNRKVLLLYFFCIQISQICNGTNVIAITPHFVRYAIRWRLCHFRRELHHFSIDRLDRTCFCVQPLSFRDAPSRTIRRGRFHVYPNR